MKFVVFDQVTGEYLNGFYDGASSWDSEFVDHESNRPEYCKENAIKYFETHDQAENAVAFLEKEFLDSGVSEDEIDFKIFRVDEFKCFRIMD